MGVPCGLTGTVELIEGSGIDIVADIPNGTYTISLSTSTLSLLGTYKIYVDETARDADNPSPSSGEAAYGQTEDTLWVHDGTGWIVLHEPWQSYTPTLTNITQGSGTVVGAYQRRSGGVQFEAMFTFGSGSAMGTNPALGLPFDADDIRASQLQVGIDDADGGANIAFHSPVAAGGDTVTLVAVSSSGTYAGSASITSTVPITWATGDILVVSGFYKMDSPYF